MPAPGDHEHRLNHLMDRYAYDHDPTYHAQVATLRNWLRVTELALKDEDVDPSTIQRVLNRIVYATPDGSDAYARIDEMQRLTAFRSTSSAPPLRSP